MNNGEFLALIKIAIDYGAAMLGLKKTETQALTTFRNIEEQAKKLGEAWGTNVVTGPKKLEKNLKGTGQEAANAAKGMGDFEKAMRRSLIVAPVWMAMRAAMQFVIQGLQEGTKYLIDFETQMFKLQQTLKATGTNTNIDALRDQFVKLSQSTGKSTAAVAANYTEFIKAHLSVQDAMAATTAATQLQDVTFNNSAAIVRAVALGYKIYGDTLGKNLTSEQKSKQVASELYNASQKNLVGIEELASEFNSFAATGDAVGLTLEQTIGLLATLNSEGVKNVTGLKTALFRTFTDTKNVAKEFGITIRPDTKPFEIFLTLLEKLRTAAKAGKTQLLGQALGEIFGKGGRGGTANVKILADALDALKGNIDKTFATESVNNFNQAIKDIDATLPHQLELWENYKKQTFEAFIIGVTGGKDFADSLKSLNNTMQNQGIPIAKQYGENLKAIGLAVGTLGIGNIFDLTTKAIKEGAEGELAFSERILAALKKQLDAKKYDLLLSDLTNENVERYLRGQENTVKYLKDHRNELIGSATAQKALTVATDKTTSAQSSLNSSLAIATKERQKDLDKLLSLSMQYEKADIFKKPEIRRAAELQQMKPEEVAAAYQNTPYDKRVIEEYFSTFNKEQQDAIAKTGELYKDIGRTLADPLMEALDRLDAMAAQNKLFQGAEVIAPPVTAANVPVLNNNYNIDVKLEGAITNDDIQGVLNKIEEKLKEQPNYIGDADINKQLEDSTKRKKAANQLREEL